MLVIWTGLATIVLYFILKYVQRKKYNLPPGPRGLPILGNMLQLDIVNPHHTITKWSEQYGDVFSMNIFGKSTVVLNGYENIYEGLVKQATRFAGRIVSYRNTAIIYHCPDIALSTFSPKWLFMKKLGIQTLRIYASLNSLETISMHQITDMLEELRSVALQGPANIYPIYGRCITGIITSIIYADKLPSKVIDSTWVSLEKLTEMIAPVSLYTMLDIFPILRYIPNRLHSTLLEHSNTLKGIIKHFISHRKANIDYDNPSCMCDELLAYQKKAKENGLENQLADDELFGIIADILGGGMVTSATTVCAFLAVMVHKPQIQDKMFEEIQAQIGDRSPKLADREKLHYIEASLLEIMRYSSLITLNLPHRTLEDANIGGYDIPKNTMVLFNLWKLHHDPRYWDEPWEFKPERYLDENGELVPVTHINRKRLMAFGASRRRCLGDALSKNRLFLIITSMVQHFKFLPAGLEEVPILDPRKYKCNGLIYPPPYRVKVALRQDNK